MGIKFGLLAPVMLAMVSKAISRRSMVMIQTTQANQHVPHQDPRSCVAILTSLFLCGSLLSACVTPDNDPPDMKKQSSAALWGGVTCPIALPPTNSMTGEAEQFEVCEPEVWGAAKNVVRLKHLYISSQPDADTLDIAREKGVALVINLRDPAESQWDERNAAHLAGLNYYNVPISGQGQSFDPLAIKKISTLIQQHQDQKILLHCSSGNRASAWLAIHLAQDHHMDTENSISVARQTGLTSALIQARVEHYLQAQTKN
ncbi:MAG: hypothetical protein ACI965_001890 [Paraglaciecola sp.]|jgi:uncharacterized protein (TIGR01244 family)